MRRREFIRLMGGAAAWPFARAQQSAMPAIGFLNPASPDAFADRLRGFCRGLADTGYAEGENLTTVLLGLTVAPSLLSSADEVIE